MALNDQGRAGEVEAERAAIVAHMRDEASNWWVHSTDDDRDADERKRAAIRAMTITDLADSIEEGVHRG